MFFLLILLANDSMHNSFENVFFGDDTVHILDKLVGFVYAVVLQVVDDKIEPSLYNHIHEWWKHLQGIFSVSEYDQIVSQEVVVL